MLTLRFSLLALMASVIAVPSAVARNPDFSQAESILREAIDQKIFPGCSVLVGTHEKILWSEGFGYFDYENQQPVTPSTIYDLASLSKVIGTTSTIMRLTAEGKIDLTAPVAQYVPEFVTLAPEDQKAMRGKVTVTDLLHHKSGLPSWKPFYRTLHTYADLIQAVASTPLEVEPGTRYRYSDIGFILLGEVAARTGGKPLPDLEKELLFQPLKMKNTLRNPPATLISRIPPTEKWPDRDEFVHGVVHDENSRAGEGITGHAGIFSTTTDLAKLARELLRGAEGKSQLFPASVVEQFTHRETDGFNRGLGWALTSGNGSAGKRMSLASYGHTGFTGTSIWIDPERKLYVILLTNRVHPTRKTTGHGRVRSDLADAVIQAVEQESP